MNGILLVDKPRGWTSFDVVNYVRKIVATSEGKKPRSIKVGHTGTLDPMATGLLVLCVGKNYTKRVPTLIKHDKTYEASIVFGARSTTGDAEGEITPDAHVAKKTKSDLDAVLPQFIGKILQSPPAYSAVKIGGKRAYELARAGKEFQTSPREIVVHYLYCRSFEWPKLEMTCHVGSGTYIRVLAEDIGKALGTYAYLSGLRRTVVDTWLVDQALTIEELSAESIRDNLLE